MLPGEQETDEATGEVTDEAPWSGCPQVDTLLGCAGELSGSAAR
jgi:hypothetical protein